MADFVNLYTAQGEQLPDVPWNIHPRPQLRRDSFLCLNGAWDFAITADDNAPESYDRTIRVPFAPESLLSGIHEVPDENVDLWYRRSFTLPDGFCRGRVLLHFGAVDQCAEVTVNDTTFPVHTGGYDAFTLDITDALQPENTVTVRVTDRLDGVLPYGKQRRKRGGMWYTPVSGIWQTVWLESVPEEYIRRLRITPTADGVTLETEGADHGQVTIRTPFGEEMLPLNAGRAEWRTDLPRLWSPEDPYLYECTITAGPDTVHSYFALRTLDIQTVDGLPRLCLNG
ncbi:MAG: glycoside hydrolase family 2, partial [Clostridia bacterium]|nr:glycoside hydrolase family 2 [Clostridia bacterium]